MENKDAEHRIERANKVIKGSLVSLVVIAIMILGLVVFQLISIQSQINDNLIKMQESAAQNHERTQEYIKCIANTLQIPISQRTDVDFENCSQTANDNTSQVQPSQGEITPQAASTDQPSTTIVNNTTNNQVTPEPTPDDGFQLHDVPLVGGLFKSLGL